MEPDSEVLFDAILAMKCRRGDADAWRQLVVRYERRLLFFIRRLVGGERDAYDILQQTWLGAIRNIRGLSEPKSLRSWLYRIARNNAITHVRQRSAEGNPVKLDEAQEQIAEEAETEFTIEQAERVHEAMARLSIAHREVLALYFLEDASAEQIAEIIAAPVGTVKSRLFYARQALRREIEKQESP